MWQKSGRGRRTQKISESEARADLKREPPTTEGERKRKGIPATASRGHPRFRLLLTVTDKECSLSSNLTLPALTFLHCLLRVKLYVFHDNVLQAGR